MSSGIVTIATGGKRYYDMARNLLYSIRVVSPDTKVGIITDCSNPYIDEYDTHVILSTPSNSYLDKIDLLIHCPYEENIFLDADSLLYKRIDYLWDLFRPGTDFSFLGERLPLDYLDGFFKLENINEKIEGEIHYIPRLHGGLYYIRPGEYCTQMWNLCRKIKDDYKTFKFKMFQEPADEPILALAASIMNSSVVERINDICFLPVTQKINANFLKERLSYIENGVKYSGSILHLSNHNTERSFYKSEVDKVMFRFSQKKLFISKYPIYFLNEYFGNRERIKCTLYKYAPECIKDTYHQMKKFIKGRKYSSKQ